MKRAEVIDLVMQTIEETFDLSPPEYSDSLTAVDIQGWDSLSNIRFMVAIEQAFDRRLTMADWQGTQCLGDLVDLLSAE